MAFRMLVRRTNGFANLCYSPMLRDVDVLSVASASASATSSSCESSSFDPTSVKSFARGGSDGRRWEVRVDNAGRTDSIEETAYLMMCDSHPDDTANLVVQLCGNDPRRLGMATNAVLEIYSRNGNANCDDDDDDRGRRACGVGILPYGIDLNLGCPQECAASGSFGAYLAEKDPELAIACVSSMRDAIDAYCASEDANRDRCINDDDVRRDNIPPLLSAKIRLSENGIDDTINFVKGLHRAGVDYVAVHCRRRTDKHVGPPDWESGKRIVNVMSSYGLPIILNGGISNYDDAVQVMDTTKCHAIMAATGYLRDHRAYGQGSHRVDAASLALEYLEYAEMYPPPSYLYVQKHLRWIFRNVLQPDDDPCFDKSDYGDWRVRLWPLLVRSFVRDIEQFRMFVALYVKLSGGYHDDDHRGAAMLGSIRHLVEDATFGSVKRAGKMMTFS
jgi:tRNA-dihydrouridine synthase